MICQETVARILKFRDDRGWRCFHNPKDLAISVSLEAAELLENFQWSGEDIDVPEKKDDIAAELADVMIYCILMADCMGFDLDQILHCKMEENEAKYTVKNAYGSKKKYTEF
jgi:NTP pyrophosphatase (non-canonical NTP hydrolase)